MGKVKLRVYADKYDYFTVAIEFPMTRKNREGKDEEVDAECYNLFRGEGTTEQDVIDTVKEMASHFKNAEIVIQRWEPVA